ncbi:MAG: HlyC/CorC family transporter [Kiritimatiellae bacterium]|nr:HlyC/CorC family transporter [Kiritimatiellia bacterium]
MQVLAALARPADPRQKTDRMITFVLAHVAALALLLLCSGFFSSAEVAFFSLNPLQVHRLDRRQTAAAAQIRELLSKPTRLLSTVLIGNTLVNIVLSVVGYGLAERLVPTRGEQIAIPAVTVLLLIFGEIGPKRLALNRAERMAVAYAPLLTLFMRIVSPLRLLLEKLTDRFRHFFRPRRATLSEEEFATVLDLSGEHGILDQDEHAMVKAIIRLGDMRASDVMTPRVDLAGVDLNDPPADLVECVRQAKVRYLLLYQDQLDRVAGFLDVRRFLLNAAAGIEASRFEPFYVPETSPLDKLLAQFLKERRRIAVVVDEYGGTAGVITRGDMIEEITGELDDEIAAHRLLFEELGLNRWLVDGRMSLEVLNSRLDLALDAEGVDRLAGWVTSLAGRLPKAGETFEAQGCRATVQRVRRHRIEVVLLEKTEPPAEAAP